MATPQEGEEAEEERKDFGGELARGQLLGNATFLVNDCVIKWQEDSQKRDILTPSHEFYVERTEAPAGPNRVGVKKREQLKQKELWERAKREADISDPPLVKPVVLPPKSKLDLLEQRGKKLKADRNQHTHIFVSEEEELTQTAKEIGSGLEFQPKEIEYEEVI